MDICLNCYEAPATTTLKISGETYELCQTCKAETLEQRLQTLGN